MDRIAMYRAYLAKKPGDRFAQYSLALELKTAGEVAEAERAFEDLLTTHPGSAAGALQLAGLLEGLARVEDAVAVLSACVAAMADSDDPGTRRERAEVEAELESLQDLL